MKLSSFTQIFIALITDLVIYKAGLIACHWKSDLALSSVANKKIRQFEWNDSLRRISNNGGLVIYSWELSSLLTNVKVL